MTAVNNALASGDRNTMLAPAADLDAKNNLGCLLTWRREAEDVQGLAASAPLPHSSQH
jgi:hypothetical protein